MARPIKCRRICSMPENKRFGPLDSPDVHSGRNSIILQVDEYEAIRLIDLEGLTQEECAAQMNIARSTVQGVYVEARKKLADSLVNGKTLLIEGGEYLICDGQGEGCGNNCNMRRRRGRHSKRNGGFHDNSNSDR